jgi:hypothetical protein
MNPEDGGATMSADEAMDEEYIGAMQNLCDAVEHWMDVQVREIEWEPVEAAEMEVRTALDHWVGIRERNRHVREEDEAE